MIPPGASLTRRALAFGVVVAVVLSVAGGCGSPPAPTLIPTATGAAPSGPSASSTPPIVEPSGPSASPAGFEFDAESIALFYASRGYACSDPQPSSQAVAHTFRSCERLDEAGRRHVVGLVTTADALLANAFASVTAAPDEAFLDPSVALEPLAGFLGATLGEARGSELLPWLAGHLGDLYAETQAGTLRVATYTESADDRTRLYVELATLEFLVAPSPPA